MKLNHIDLPVTEPSRVRRFFEQVFEMKCIFEREYGLTVLLDEDGSALTLSPLPHDEASKYPNGIPYRVQCRSRTRGSRGSRSCCRRRCASRTAVGRFGRSADVSLRSAGRDPGRGRLAATYFALRKQVGARVLLRAPNLQRCGLIATC
jgi:hypothetical protein